MIKPSKLSHENRILLLILSSVFTMAWLVIGTIGAVKGDYFMALIVPIIIIVLTIGVSVIMGLAWAVFTFYKWVFGISDPSIPGRDPKEKSKKRIRERPMKDIDKKNKGQIPR